MPKFLLFFLTRIEHENQVGGATGEVGDPSGRKTERTQIQSSERTNNVEHIQAQLSAFLERGAAYAATRGYSSPGTKTLRNNASWWKPIGMLEFLATYGRHIRIGQMMARDSIKSRLESEAGIGFNEFTYQILQAYDFWHLYSTENCRVQVGGNDQWGNITAGIDLITRLNRQKRLEQGDNEKSTEEKEAFGITVPLLTTPSGEKFGKSAGNAIWIDPTMTRPYELYQVNIVIFFIHLFSDKL